MKHLRSTIEEYKVHIKTKGEKNGAFEKYH